jgi:hypothetical protein
MLPRRAGSGVQHPGEVQDMSVSASIGSKDSNDHYNAIVLAGEQQQQEQQEQQQLQQQDQQQQQPQLSGAGGTAVPLSGAAPPRKSSLKVKSSISREEASLLPIALEGVHWRREEAPPHSKSGSAVTRCLMLTDPSCVTFSRRNYLEDHFRIVHKLFPSKPRVGRKKISNKPSRCISPSARERMADHMQGDFPFKFWKAKKKRFVMSTTKAKHMWCSVPGHENASEEVRRDWMWCKAANFYKIWREGSLALDTMMNLASHVEDYWNGKGIVDEEEVAKRVSSSKDTKCID